MANFRSIERVMVPAYLSFETAGRLRTWLKGKTKPAMSRHGEKIRKPRVKMVPSDFFEDLASRALADVQMDAESRRWVAMRYEKNIETHKAQTERAVANRKDVNWKGPGYASPNYAKRGVKKGKVSQKYLAAMKALGEKRRKEGWKRGPNKNKTASPAPTTPKRRRPRKNPEPKK